MKKIKKENNENSIIISGFGGQGVLLAGIMLSKCAMNMKKFVTWLPSYGAQMRGGTANCTVVISDDEVSSPVQKKPDFVIALNSQSVERFENDIKPDGVIFVNTNEEHIVKKRTDIKYFSIPANVIAKKIGEIKCANLVMLGAFLQLTNLLPIKSLQKAIVDNAKGANAKFAEINHKAVILGAEFVSKMIEKTGNFFPEKTSVVVSVN